MINRIKICEDGHIFPDSLSLGRTGEEKSVILEFDFFETLNGLAVSALKKVLVAVNSLGSFSYELQNDEFALPPELTSDPTVDLQFIIDGGSFIWKSEPKTFTVDESINSSGENILDSAIAEARVEFEEDLRRALEAALGADLSDEDWAELLETIEHLGILNNLIAEINQMIDESGVVEYDNSVEA